MSLPILDSHLSLIVVALRWAKTFRRLGLLSAVFATALPQESDRKQQILDRYRLKKIPAFTGNKTQRTALTVMITGRCGLYIFVI
jgi:hypothetical protein